jgi:hypothetical protein
VQILSKSDVGSDTELHHPIPRSFKRKNNKEVVRLSFRKHFLAHWLLTKCTSGQNQKKMCRALRLMTHNKYGKRIISSWQYAVARRAMVQAMLGNQITLGYKHTDESKKKISEASASHVATEEQREKTSSSVKLSWEKRHDDGWTHSAKTRESCSQASIEYWSKVHAGLIIRTLPNPESRRKSALKSRLTRGSIIKITNGIINRDISATELVNKSSYRY